MPYLIQGDTHADKAKAFVGRGQTQVVITSSKDALGHQGGNRVRNKRAVTERRREARVEAGGRKELREPDIWAALDFPRGAGFQ